MRLECKLSSFFPTSFPFAIERLQDVTYTPESDICGRMARREDVAYLRYGEEYHLELMTQC